MKDESLSICPEIVTADWACQNIQRRWDLPSGLSGDGAVTRAVLGEIMRSFGADDAVALGAGHVLDDAALTYETYTDFMNRLRFATPDAKTYSTPGTYSLTIPAGVRKITVDAVAGGGGGGSGSYGGGGSSGQGITAREFDVTYGQTLSITVGGGGAVGANGGDTSVTGLFAVQGGKAGSSNGTAGASSGAGSRAGSAGYTQQVVTSQTQTGGGYYEHYLAFFSGADVASTLSREPVMQGLERLKGIYQSDDPSKKFIDISVDYFIDAWALDVGTVPSRGTKPLQAGYYYCFLMYSYSTWKGFILRCTQNSRWVPPTYSYTYGTAYTKGTGGASVISGYGKGGDGAQSGQAGCVKIDWVKA